MKQEKRGYIFRLVLRAPNSRASSIPRSSILRLTIRMLRRTPPPPPSAFSPKKIGEVVYAGIRRIAPNPLAGVVWA